MQTINDLLWFNKFEREYDNINDMCNNDSNNSESAEIDALFLMSYEEACKAYNVNSIDEAIECIRDYHA